MVVLLYAIATRGTARAGALAPAAERKPLPDFALSDLHGKPWRLAEHRGEVVLLNFWATWCPPCRQETPGLVRLANSYPQSELAVVGISIDEGGPDGVREFVSEFNIPYTVAMPDKDFPLASGVQGLPTTLLIDKQGRLAKTYIGGASESVFRSDVDTLLQEPAERN
ncbi:MAG TPA: TlpA disulfide reductase family protein [Bryobacteraceae bacterium]